MKLLVPASLVGKLTLSDGTDEADVELTAAMTNAEVITALTVALGTLGSVGANNARVTGNRDEGYEIEFIGELEGKPVEGLSVSATPAASSFTVTQAQAADPGADEVKLVVVQALREAPAPVTVEVDTVTAGQPGVDEANTIVFTTPGTGGTYSVYFVADGTVTQTQAGVQGSNEVQRLTLAGDLQAAGGASSATVTTVSDGTGTNANERYAITFTKQFGRQGFKLYMVDNPVTTATTAYANNAENTTETIAQLKAAYVAMFAANGRTVQAGDIQVTIDNGYTGTGHRYLVEFAGSLAGQDIGRIGMISEKGAFIHTHEQDGAAGTAEVQKVVLKTTGAGSFTIGVKVGSKDYVSTGIEYGANAATVRYALNAALGQAGSVQVASSVKGTYVITFEGALQGQDLAPVTVTMADAQSGPAGSFTLQLAGQTTRSIAYTADGAALAK
jgi:hypothetical protein